MSSSAIFLKFYSLFKDSICSQNKSFYIQAVSDYYLRTPFMKIETFLGY